MTIQRWMLVALLAGGCSSRGISSDPSASTADPSSADMLPAAPVDMGPRAAACDGIDIPDGPPAPGVIHGRTADELLRALVGRWVRCSENGPSVFEAIEFTTDRYWFELARSDNGSYARIGGFLHFGRLGITDTNSLVFSWSSGWTDSYETDAAVIDGSPRLASLDNGYFVEVP